MLLRYATKVTCDVSTTSLEETLPVLRGERPDATGYDRVCSVEPWSKHIYSTKIGPKMICYLSKLFFQKKQFAQSILGRVLRFSNLNVFCKTICRTVRGTVSKFGHELNLNDWTQAGQVTSSHSLFLACRICRTWSLGFGEGSMIYNMRPSHLHVELTTTRAPGNHVIQLCKEMFEHMKNYQLLLGGVSKARTHKA